MTTRRQAAYALGVLFAVNTLNFFDRNILGAVGELVRTEWNLNDKDLGWMGTAFILLYAAVGVPLGRLTDQGSRRKILAAGVTVWSLLTALSGAAQGYWQLFAARLGVGVGEASCAPAATSLIGDFFHAAGRARAMSVFMLGLPIGIALCYAASGSIALVYGWRWAFYIAFLPGLLCALASLFIEEPRRGATEAEHVGSRRRDGSPYWLVLSIPTMWWIIASGALHNFNMYAIGSFLAPLLMRLHKLNVRDAGLIVMVVYGLSGIGGLALGGIVGDMIRRQRINGRLVVATICLGLSVPLGWLALYRLDSSLTLFAVLMTISCGLMYTYYSTVYSTIHDVIEPALRGTAMALYFFAMYLLGAALGPLVMGYLSAYFTDQAALAGGVTDLTPEALNPFRGVGLHRAMYIVPTLNLCLAAVLFAASRTVARDVDRLDQWMRSEPAEDSMSPAEELMAAS